MNKKISLLIVFVSGALLPLVASAQAALDQIRTILVNLQWIFFVIFDGLVVIMCVYAGILYLTARGEPGKVQKANQAIIWAAVGIAVGILANSASKIVNWLLGNPPQ